jgi:hypothetical protein
MQLDVQEYLQTLRVFLLFFLRLFFLLVTLLPEGLPFLSLLFLQILVQLHLHEEIEIIRKLRTPFYNCLDRGDYSNAALIALQVASYDERISGSMMREVIQESFKSGDPIARTNAEEVWSKFLKRRS